MNNLNCQCEYLLDLSKNKDNLIICPNCQSIYYIVNQKIPFLFKIRFNEDDTFDIIGHLGSKNYISLPEAIKYLDKTYYLRLLDSDAFNFVDDLIGLEIPSVLQGISIGTLAFCSSLQYSIYEDVRYLGNKDNLYLVAIKSIKKDMTHLILHKETKVIMDGAFYGLEKLKSVSLSNDIKKIGARTFESCRALEEITLPSELKVIADKAFYYCDSLKEIFIPKSVNSIGSLCFALCDSLKEVIIEKDSLLSIIKSGAFANCYALERIVIPKNVTKIEQSVFNFCFNLYIYLENSSIPKDFDKTWNLSNRYIFYIDKWHYDENNKPVLNDNKLTNN